MRIKVKICGIRDEAALKAALDGGAKYIGFNFYPKSLNVIKPEEARKLAMLMPPGVVKTGLFVDMEDTYIRAVAQSVPLDLIQLHGNESPTRVGDLHRITRLPIMKVLRMR